MPVTIRQIRDLSEIAVCAGFMAASEPWITLGRGLEDTRRVLTDPDAEKFAAEADGKIAGCLVLVMRGAFVGYVKAICVAPELRGQGIGSNLIRFAEERIFKVSPNVFICVSSFNHGARRFYEGLGYETVGELRDYVVKGYSEILLRKTIGPIGRFTKESGS